MSDAGGSRRSYRNGRVDSAVAERTPFPKGEVTFFVNAGSYAKWSLFYQVPEKVTDYKSSSCM